VTTLPHKTYPTLAETVFAACDEINNGRTLQDILTHLVTEVGELALEIQIQNGKSYKIAHKNGPVDEAIDVIACALDIIHTYAPEVTDLDLQVMMQHKLKKWKDTQCPSVE